MADHALDPVLRGVYIVQLGRCELLIVAFAAHIVTAPRDGRPTGFVGRLNKRQRARVHLFGGNHVTNSSLSRFWRPAALCCPHQNPKKFGFHGAFRCDVNILPIEPLIRRAVLSKDLTMLSNVGKPSINESCTVGSHPRSQSSEVWAFAPCATRQSYQNTRATRRQNERNSPGGGGSNYVD